MHWEKNKNKYKYVIPGLKTRRLSLPRSEVSKLLCQSFTTQFWVAIHSLGNAVLDIALEVEIGETGFRFYKSSSQQLPVNLT